MQYAAIPRSRPAPPPLPPAAAPSNAFLDQTADDVRRLTADIDQVLSRQPPALSRRLSAVRLVSPADEARAMSRSVSGDGDGADEFDWRAEPAQRGRHPSRADAAQAAGWLRKAKRERRTSRLRSALSWLIALGFGAGIVAASALLILGELPSLNEVVAMVRNSGL